MKGCFRKKIRLKKFFITEEYFQDLFIQIGRTKSKTARVNIPINYAHTETEIGFTIIRMASSHFDIQNIKSQGDKVVFSISVLCAFIQNNCDFHTKICA